MRRQFKDTCLSLAEKDERVVLVFGDLSVYLFKEFSERFPERFLNLGILEQTMISAGAGLAATGLIPFVHSITPFLVERAYEQIKLDLCYNEFGVNLVSTGASFDYTWDGPSHHCYTDLALLRLLPGMEVTQPGTPQELDTLLCSQYANGKPSYFRMSDHCHGFDFSIEFGKGVVVRHSAGKGGPTVVTAGPILKNVVEACTDLSVNILYFSTIKPIDQKLLQHYAQGPLVVVHDAFGLFEAVNEAVPQATIYPVTMQDRFVQSYGTVHDAHQDLGFDTYSIQRFVKETCSV
ncbi:transketolase family protein [Planctomycetota bacterium]